MSKIMVALIIFYLLSMAQAKEAIIYLNLNNNNAYSNRPPANDEIIAARKAAQANHQELIIIPPTLPKEKLDARGFCKSLQETLGQRKDLKVTSLVISGHDGGGSYGGSIGSVTRHDLQEIMKIPEIQKNMENVSGLYLWGCYTNTVGETAKWDMGLKNTSMIVGFDQKSPTNPQQDNANALYSFLTRQKSFLTQADINEFKKAIGQFSSLKLSASLFCEANQYKPLYAHKGEDNKPTLRAISMEECRDPAIHDKLLKASLLVSKYRFCGLSTLSVDAHIRRLNPEALQASALPRAPTGSEISCDSFSVENPVNQNKEKMTRANQARKSEEPCVDVPEDTPARQGYTELRAAYNDIRNYEHCFTEGDLAERFENPNRTIFLVKGRQVLKNFRTVFQKDLQKIATDLKELVPQILNAQDIQFLSKPDIGRAEWLQGVSRLSDKISPIYEQKVQQSMVDSKEDNNKLFALFKEGKDPSNSEEVRRLVEKVDQAKEKALGPGLFSGGKLIHASDQYVFDSNPGCMDYDWMNDTAKDIKQKCNFDGKPLK